MDDLDESASEAQHIAEDLQSHIIKGNRVQQDIDDQIDQAREELNESVDSVEDIAESIQHHIDAANQIQKQLEAA